FSIGFIMLFIVRHEVMQCEAIVRRNEVDTRSRPAVVALIKVRTSGKPGGELAKHAIRAAPVVTDTIAVFTVPLRPSRGKVSHLITSLTDIPRFGYEFHLRNHRILIDHVEE